MTTPQFLAITRESRNMRGGAGITVEMYVMRHASMLVTVYTAVDVSDVRAMIPGRAIVEESAF